MVTNNNYNYIEKGQGETIILLHGLMGAVSNFESTIETLPKYGYRVILPMLPLYEMPILKTNVQQLAKIRINGQVWIRNLCQLLNIFGLEPTTVTKRKHDIFITSNL